MASSLKEYSTVAINNTDLGSSASNIEENCAIKNFNNALRGIMAHIAGRFGNTAGTLASAATTDLGTIEPEYVTITGSVGITSFGTPTNRMGYWTRFTGSPPLTHGANIILPGSANITAAPGDVAYFKNEGGSVWRCLQYLRASGLSLVQGTGRFLKVTDFSASGSFTKQTGTNFAIIEAISGGGAGGGIGARGIGDAAAAGAGQNGAYLKFYITGANLPGACTVTIGAAGVGASGADGGDGGDTEFDNGAGVLFALTGGKGGKAMSGGTSMAVALGGLTGATFSFSGGSDAYPLELGQNAPGASGIRLSGSLVVPANLILPPSPLFETGSFLPFGTGRDGRSSTSNGSAIAGQNGTGGFMRFWEYS